MTVADEQSPDLGQPGPEISSVADAPHGHDIGVGPIGGAPQTAGSRPSTAGRRSLPVWALVVVALFVGWVLGALLGSSGSDADSVASPVQEPTQERAAEVAEPPASQPERVSEVTQTERPQTGAPQTETLPVPNTTLVLAEQFVDGNAASVLTTVDEFGTSSLRLGTRFTEPNSLAGRARERVQTAAGMVLFTADGQVYVFDASSQRDLVAVTDADVLLAGTGSGNVWVSQSDTRLVQILDVASRSVRATYDLSGVGDAIGSYDGGLIVAPDIERFGRFALWSPARGIERLWSLDDQATYIDSAGSAVVVHTAQGIASYDTVTGALTQTDRQISPTEWTNAVVSPDGRRLGYLDRSSPASGVADVTVVVVDLVTGDTIDRFPTSEPVAVHWATGDEIVHRSATNDRLVQLRNITLGFDTTLLELESAVAWMAVVTQ